MMYFLDKVVPDRSGMDNMELFIEAFVAVKVLHSQQICFEDKEKIFITVLYNYISIIISY